MAFWTHAGRAGGGRPARTACMERGWTMKVDLREVEHVALLARIELAESEREGYAETLSSILAFFDRLKEVDTEGVAPTSHVLDLTNALRPDRREPSLDVEETLRNAPDRSERFFRVPKIIDG